MHGLAVQAAVASQMEGSPDRRTTSRTKKSGIQLVGKKCQIWWDGEETFFSGTITGCSMEAEEEHVYKVHYEDGDEDPRIKFLTYELVLDEENGAPLVRVTRSAALNSKECTPEVPELSVAALPSWAMNDTPTMIAAVVEDCARAAMSPGVIAQRNGLVQAPAEAAESTSTASQPAGPAQALARAAKASSTASLSTGHKQASAGAAQASSMAADPAGHMGAPAGTAVALGTIAQPSTIRMAEPAAMETQLGSAETVVDAPSASTAAPAAGTAADDGAGRLVVQAEKSAIAAVSQQGGSAEAANGKPQQSQKHRRGKDQAVPRQCTHDIAADTGKAGTQRGCQNLLDPHDGKRLGPGNLAVPGSQEGQQRKRSKSESPCVPLSPPARVPLHQGVGCASWRVPLPSQDQEAPAGGSGQDCRADDGAAGAQAAAEQQSRISGAAETLRGRYRGWPFSTTLPQQENVRSQVLRLLPPSWSNGLHDPSVDRQGLERAKHRLLDAVRISRASTEQSPAAQRGSAEQAATRPSTAAEAGRRSRTAGPDRGPSGSPPAKAQPARQAGPHRSHSSSHSTSPAACPKRRCEGGDEPLNPSKRPAQGAVPQAPPRTAQVGTQGGKPGLTPSRQQAEPKAQQAAPHCLSEQHQQRQGKGTALRGAPRADQGSPRPRAQGNKGLFGAESVLGARASRGTSRLKDVRSASGTPSHRAGRQRSLSRAHNDPSQSRSRDRKQRRQHDRSRSASVAHGSRGSWRRPRQRSRSSRSLSGSSRGRKRSHSRGRWRPCSRGRATSVTSPDRSLSPVSDYRAARDRGGRPGRSTSRREHPRYSSSRSPTTSASSAELERRRQVRESQRYNHRSLQPTAQPDVAPSASMPFHQGRIFLCRDATFEECMRSNLFGSKRKGDIAGVDDDTAIFLFDEDRRKLMGPWVSIKEGELEPAAFRGSLPYQVRVKKHLPVLFDPLDGETIKRVLEPSRSSPVGFELHLKKPELSRLWRTMDARSTKKER